jgi:CheY-like chemotaxis protein
LLVEDIEINRDIVLTLPKDTHAVIDCAENGQAAVDMIAANPERYNLIYMDIQMPLIDGYTATKQIRSMEAERGGKAKRIPIIAHNRQYLCRRRGPLPESGDERSHRKTHQCTGTAEKTAQYLGTTETAAP